MKLDFGGILHACRERAGYSQEKMAEVLNLSRSCISKIEKNHKLPNIYTIMAWAEKTNTREVLVAYMYGLDGMSMLQNVMQVTGVA